MIAQSFREEPPGGGYQSMTEACVARDVERNAHLFNDIARPLSLRPPFREWK